MEFCLTSSFDFFETIKLFTPYILAIIVYFIWHRQKKKEVISDISKEAFEEIEIIIINIINLENYIVKFLRNNNIKMTRDELSDSLMNNSSGFENAINRFNSRVELIGKYKKIKYLNDLKDHLGHQRNIIFNLIIDINDLYFNNGHLTDEERKNFDKDLDNHVKELINDLNDSKLKTKLINLILYKTYF